MSALARLAALASGRASSRLRPVLPARFEPGGFGEEGFSERHEEIPAPPVAAPDRATEPAPQTLESPADPHAPKAPSEPPTGRTLAPKNRDTGPDAPPAPLIEPPEPTLRDVQSASFDPAMPTSDALTPTPPSGRKEQPAPHPPDAPIATASAVPGATPPPPPLLPPAPRPGFDPEPAPSAAKSDRRAPAAPAGSAAPPAPPPEITIHIGRIELREAAPPPRERPRPERRAPQVTPLGDYLKGGSG